MKKLMDLVAQPMPPRELVEEATGPDAPHIPSPTQAWLRRVAFLLAAAAPALGCNNSGISSGDVCAAYAAKVVECGGYYYAGYQEYIEQYCNSYLEDSSAYGELCPAALEDYFACISHLSCAELEGGTGDPCEEEVMRLEQHCDTGAGSGSDSDSDF